MVVDETEYARLKWRCRRGMLELDLLLQPFVERVYPTLSGDEQHQFHLLLDMPDQELLECLLMQRTPEDRSLDHVIRKIRDSV